jgi:hypothetical protein
MILTNAKKMDSEEKKKNMVVIQVSFDHGNPYEICIKQHKLKNSLQIMYKKAIFRQKKNTCACRPLSIILRQICRNYIQDNELCHMAEGDNMNLKIMYKGETIFEDSHFVGNDVHDFSLDSEESEDSFEFDQLFDFFMDYYRMIEQMEMDS